MPSALAARRPQALQKTSGLSANERAVDDVLATACSAFEVVKPGESAKNGRLGRLTWEFSIVDVLNGNRRIYPKDVWEAALKLMQPRVERKQVYGNLDHPPDWDTESRTVKIGDACILIPEISLVNGTKAKVVGDILDNEHGWKLVAAINAGGNPGLSQRAVAVFHEITSIEREKYAVPEGQWAVVAELMRLITFDVVSEPSHGDATDPTISEAQNPAPALGDPDQTLEPGVESMDLATLRLQHPNLIAQITNEARANMEAEIVGRIDRAVAEKKPTIVTEAIQPLQTQLAAKDTELGVLKTALGAVKPVMVKLGLVNEQITDAEARAQVLGLTTENAALQQKLRDAETKLATEAAAHGTLQSKVSGFENLGKIAELYKDHPARALIIDAAKRLPNLGDLAAATESIKHTVTMLEAANPSLKPQASGTNPGTAINDMMAGFGLMPNFQAPSAGAAGAAPVFPNPGAQAGANGAGANGANAQVATEGKQVLAGFCADGGGF